MPKKLEIDLLDIDQQAGSPDWLAQSKQRRRDEIRKKNYAKHRAKYLTQQREDQDDD